MKRHLLIIAIWLLLGAVVNVAVAWGCFVSADWVFDTRGLSITEGDVEWWSEHVPAEFPAEPSYFYISSALGYVSRNYSWGLPGHVPHPYHLKRCSAGLPFRSLFIVVVGTRNESGDSVLFRSTGLQQGPSFFLPLRPEWPGFAINTIFYAAILWLLIPGPFALRRFLRVRRGLCPKCAYPMGESSVCTECGCELPKRARAT